MTDRQRDGSTRTTRLLLLTGGVGVVLGTITTTIYLFQPWRTCPYDDSPAACAMLPGDAAVLAVAVVVVLVGAFALAAGLVRSRGTRRGR